MGSDTAPDVRPPVDPRLRSGPSRTAATATTSPAAPLPWNRTRSRLPSPTITRRSDGDTIGGATAGATSKVETTPRWSVGNLPARATSTCGLPRSPTSRLDTAVAGPAESTQSIRSKTSFARPSGPPGVQVKPGIGHRVRVHGAVGVHEARAASVALAGQMTG